MSKILSYKTGFSLGRDSFEKDLYVPKLMTDGLQSIELEITGSVHLNYKIKSESQIVQYSYHENIGTIGYSLDVELYNVQEFYTVAKREKVIGGGSLLPNSSVSFSFMDKVIPCSDTIEVRNGLWEDDFLGMDKLHFGVSMAIFKDVKIDGWKSSTEELAAWTDLALTVRFIPLSRQ